MAQNLRAGDVTGAKSSGAPGATMDEQSTARLLGGIVSDAQKLVRQEIALARVELQEEWRKTKLAAGQFTIAVVMGFVTVFIAGITLAQILIAIGVSPWLSYLLVTAVYGAVSLGLTLRGKAAAKQIEFVPRQTVETMKENVQWIKNQT